jgi:hypothetical protein
MRNILVKVVKKIKTYIFNVMFSENLPVYETINCIVTFTLQQLLNERATLLRYTYTHVVYLVILKQWMFVVCFERSGGGFEVMEEHISLTH